MKARIVSVLSNKRRRSGVFLLVLVLLAVIFTACSPASKAESMAGYIIFEENTLFIDPIEIITTKDTARITELQLSQSADMPNGYYLLNDSIEKQDYQLTEKTVYTFTDVDLLFIKPEDADGDRLYTTTKKEEFLQHLLTSYSDDPPAQKVPFFVEVKNGKVISVREEFSYTI